MRLGGLQKLTLLDFPGCVACTVFTIGCNFRCPFCHNAMLVDGGEEALTEEEFFSFLAKRAGVLEGVAITGGEPLIHHDIARFIERIRAYGYKVKLDTNGSFPEKLKDLVTAGLVDYVAMDVKNAFGSYAFTSGVNVSEERIGESLNFLLEGKVDYEFRTTVVKGHHDEAAMRKIGETIRGAKRYYLQNFTDSGNLLGTAEGVNEETMKKFLSIVREYVPSAELRGI